ncbi:MAG: TerC family protein [Limisphaerales bacterium]
MLFGLVEIQWWHWASFVMVILVFLALDLGFFHREAHVVSFREALAWTSVWFTTAMIFAVTLVPVRGGPAALDFVQGYLIELSLSMDNVFVIAMIFGYFKVPREFQHRVLFWGILGALVMRGVMIWLGSELIERYQWTLYIFGMFLLVTAVRMLVGDDEEEIHPERNPVIRLVRRYFPVSPDYDGQKFLTLVNGRRILTPMAVVLVMVETTDLVFALDSIPAIFGVTTDRFIVFTSNVFAILGLRSLYFVLAGAIACFRYLKTGLALVLAFIGIKMLIVKWVHIPSEISLPIVVGIILASIAWSLWCSRGGRTAGKRRGDDGDPTA